MSNRKYRLDPLRRLKGRIRKRAEMVLAKTIGVLEKEKKQKKKLEDEKQLWNVPVKADRTSTR